MDIDDSIDLKELNLVWTSKSCLGGILIFLMVIIQMLLDLCSLVKEILPI